MLAWDWGFTAIAKTTTLLLLGTDGQYVVHEHSAPTGDDLVAPLDGEAARTLYRRLRMHNVPFERLSGSIQ